MKSGNLVLGSEILDFADAVDTAIIIRNDFQKTETRGTIESFIEFSIAVQHNH